MTTRDTIVSTVLDEYFASGPPNLTGEDGHDLTCSLCQRSYESTAGYPTQTLICGHRYHTVCYYIFQDYELRACPKETCEFPIWETLRNVNKKIEQRHVDQVDEFLEETIRSSEFKKELKAFKASIRGVTRSHAIMQNKYKTAYDQFIHTHLYTINQLQSDLTRAISNVKTTDEIKQYKKALAIYRKSERTMFRKYNVSFRDLRRRNIVNVSWKLRWVLERHRASLSIWKYILKIKPDGKLFTDPIRNEEAQEV